MNADRSQDPRRSAFLSFVIFFVLYEVLTSLCSTLMLTVEESGRWKSLSDWMITNPSEVLAFRTAVCLILSAVPVLPAGLRCIRAYEDEALSSVRGTYIGRESSQYLQRGALFILLSVFASLFLNIFFALTGMTAWDSASGTVASLQTGAGLIVSISVYGILSPLCEEMVFRGIVFTAYSRSGFGASSNESVFRDAGTGMGINGMTPVDSKKSRSPFKNMRVSAFLEGAFISSLLFAFYHGLAVQGVYAFLMGMLFCAAFACTHSFAAVFLMHAADNITSIVMSQGGRFASVCTPVWLCTFAALCVVTAGTVVMSYGRK
ncbi:MAG: CPBP family intramembrane metalloprotease [Lachnospiraceae bacterium]|nr:CPBP family intramembrane metalloprotease [Lachnospiraceae bacterium]